MPADRSVADPRPSILIYRILAGLVAVGATVYNLLSVGTASSQDSALSPLFASLATAALFGLPIVVGLASFWVPIRVLKGLAGAHAIAYALAVILWVPAMSAVGGQISGSPWLIDIAAVPAAMGAVAWPMVASWLYTAGISVGVGYLVAATETRADFILVVENGLYATLTCAIFVALIHVTIRLGRDLGLATASARLESAKAARVVALNAERARFDALIHDDVIAALLAAGRAVGVSQPLLIQQAAETLRKLDAQSVAEVRTEPFDTKDFVALMRSVVTGIAPGVTFSATLETSVEVPPATASAMGEALGEALRNSLLHAAPRADGPEVERLVEIRDAGGGVLISVRDTGQGFSPKRVAPTRLGIAVSIRDRMASIVGGYSLIHSSSAGTEVRLGWSPA